MQAGKGNAGFRVVEMYERTDAGFINFHLEFEFRPDGKLRYANNSNYKNDTMIPKEVFLTPSVLKECRRIVSDSDIMKEDDNCWPEPDRVGRQELEKEAHETNEAYNKFGPYKTSPKPLRLV